MCVASPSKNTFAQTAPTDTEQVSVEEKVIVDTEEEEKLALQEEFFILDDPEEDQTTSEPAASPTSTNITNLLVDQPTTSAQLFQHSSPSETPHLPTDTGPVSVKENANNVVEKFAVDYNVLYDQQVGIPTTTTNATNTQDIKIHIYLEATTRIKMMRSEKLSDLIPYIEEHLKQRVTENDILKINTKSMKRNVEKNLRQAMKHCGDLDKFKVSRYSSVLFYKRNLSV